MQGLFMVLTGLGVLLCAGTGMICAACVKDGPTFCDPCNVRAHWRGALQVGAIAFVAGLLGQMVIAIVG